MAMRDVILVAVVLFTFGMAFFVINFVGNTMNTNLVAVATINESDAAVNAFGSMADTVDRLDYVLFALFLGLVLALIVTAWFVGGYPIFMFIYFLVIVVGVVISAVLANVWESVTSEVVFGATIANFPITNNLISNLPIYVAVVGFIGIVVMFAKPGGEQ